MHDGTWWLDGGWFFGMHLFWWLFWIVVIVAFFSLLTPVPKNQPRTGDPPLDILQRRFAAGEIGTEEYQQRKAILTRDQPAGEPHKH